MSADVAIIAAVIVAFALISKRIGPMTVSGPMVFVAAGLILGPEFADAVDLGLELPAVSLIGETTLAILLFSDASRIETQSLRHDFALPARLLGIGLPLTVGLGTLAVWLFINDISGWEAALVAAIVAPTDAALGQEVVTNPAVPSRVRQGLNVESGLNDGMVVPAVALFTVLASGEEDAGSGAFWLRFVFQQVGVALLVGLLVGGVGAWLLAQAQEADWADGLHMQLATLALAVGALATSLAFDGNGFIAAFVAGLAFGRVSPNAEHLGEYTEDTAQLAASISFFLFGNILLGPALTNVSPRILACAVFVLTLGRLIPVGIALIGTRSARPTVLFVGWFGPRGLASILFGLGLLEDGLESAEALFGIVAWTVLLSVVLHGATAAWGAQQYGRWWASMGAPEKHSMPEGVVVTEHRARKWHQSPPK